MYEERHGYQRYWGGRQTDWPTTSMDGTRRLMWWWSMAGGCGSIYGFYSKNSAASADGPYPNPEYLRTHNEFWQDRLHLDSEPAAHLVSENSGVYALRSDSAEEVVFWGEDVSSIDLSKVSNIQSIIAVNAKEVCKPCRLIPTTWLTGFGKHKQHLGAMAEDLSRYLRRI